MNSGSTSRTAPADGRARGLAEATPFVPIPWWFVLGIGSPLTACIHGCAGRPARGATCPVDCRSLRQRPRDRGLLSGLFLDIRTRNESGRIAPTESLRKLNAD